MKSARAIPVIDLFAGPGGLAEGFSRVKTEGGQNLFKVMLSVEMNALAHKTLTTRAFYRQFDVTPPAYYEYLHQNISREELFSRYPEETRAAKNEALCAELGSPRDDLQIESRISAALNGKEDWVLIGGPPCQAYSLAGRSRRAKETRAEFESDPRHTLYLEYLKVIHKHRPSVFVMENVKGLLSSKLDGRPVFDRIINDLERPSRTLNESTDACRYRVISLAKESSGELFGRLESKDFVLKCEDYGIPQNRHRVIIVGFREDLKLEHPGTLQNAPAPSVFDVIGDLPRLRSYIGARWTSGHTWSELISSIINQTIPQLEDAKLASKLADAVHQLDESMPTMNGAPTAHRPMALNTWYEDPYLEKVLNHEARSHMPDDLARYVFCGVFANHMGRPPTLHDFPERLLPAHQNAKSANKFVDRFKVQMSSKPSSTVTSHISRDGHYFIHPNPSLARSFTVREAARLQTFPDNYLFEGPRTSQYHQVGNAVPPLLAYQVAQKIAKCF